MKIFYSWQSDAPNRTNRNFIRKALDDAIERIQLDADLSEAERQDIEVRSDTQGVLGSPSIAETILDRIANADVFLADVTLIEAQDPERGHINSNVAIELGFAYGKNGHEPILKVMNTAFGPPEKLPFDLRGRRNPILYCAPANGQEDERREERTRLSRELEAVLRQYLAAAGEARPVQHQEIQHRQESRADYWNESEVVPASDREESPLVCTDNRLLYFRCIPLSPLADLSSAQAYDQSGSFPPLAHSGHSSARNRWGAVRYYADGEPRQLYSFTQLFKNREVWSVDRYYPNILEDDAGFPGSGKTYIPVTAAHNEMRRNIDVIRRGLVGLDYGNRYLVELGLSGAQETYLTVSSVRIGGPIFEDEVFVRREMSESEATDSLLQEFWVQAFEAAGYLDIPGGVLSGS